MNDTYMRPAPLGMRQHHLQAKWTFEEWVTWRLATAELRGQG